MEVKDLHKKYRNGRGIGNINFDIYPGEVVGLLGPNGSGKTTIMKSITGLVRIDKGTVRICGHDLSENFEKAIRGVGCLIETPSVIGNMSCYDNLKLISRFYNDIDPERIDVVLQITGLEKYRKDKVRNFSLGMKQRLAIAMAIYQNPKLVILDEPANGLDIEGSKELRRIISELSKEFMISFLISSHLIHEIEMLCDKILIIKDGSIVDTCIVQDVKDIGVSLEDYFIDRVNGANKKSIDSI
ncbi:Sulfate-transporting ATPase [Pseudobacteroides cellulosolvens ATCC 35603 = DSM 2933]|uniref:Sulfate-transporting ATPase n=1 Tax=Pseudobacteroides cellulosolvens ATCC 35603 = DSM 2933 TaxID=398512 RepID=A0A0L6JV25_9FIRM|nr:Sulfate-transporting ATPase [Pseudobacteroides cellulosolvens ATCC 35603 = DSM 2933]